MVIDFQHKGEKVLTRNLPCVPQHGDTVTLKTDRPGFMFPSLDMYKVESSHFIFKKEDESAATIICGLKKMLE